MKYFFVIAVLLMAMRAHAGNWWMIQADGVKPERKMIYANADSVRSNLTSADILAGNYGGKISVEVITVFESAEAPDRIQSRYLVDCKKQLISTDLDWVVWRDDRIEKRNTMTWAPIVVGTPEDRVRLFSCDEIARNDANQMLYVGGVGLSPVEMSWKLFWKDGVRPAYTTKKSIEEVDAIYKDVVADIKQTIDANKKLYASDLKWRKEASRRRALREPSRVGDQLERFVGMGEQRLIRMIGIPAGSYQAGGVHFLSYHDEFQQTYDNGYTYTSHYCDITFELYEGKVIDFKAKGDYCDVMLRS